MQAQDEAIAEAHRNLADRDAAISALQAAGKAAEARIAALTLQAAFDTRRGFKLHAADVLMTILNCCLTSRRLAMLFTPCMHRHHANRCAYVAGCHDHRAARRV